MWQVTVKILHFCEYDSDSASDESIPADLTGSFPEDKGCHQRGEIHGIGSLRGVDAIYAFPVILVNVGGRAGECTTLDRKHGFRCFVVCDRPGAV